MTQTALLETHMFPCLSDNYGFLIHDPIHKITAAIDTPEVTAIQNALEEKNWSLTHIINTHHHYDHAGGNLELKDITDCRIIGPEADQSRIPGIDQTIAHEEEFQFGEHKVKAFHTPGHTLGHMVYHFEEQRLAFVGDTLFAMGCGRLFEGTPEQMWSSLNIIKGWPEKTQLFWEGSLKEPQNKCGPHLTLLKGGLRRRSYFALMNTLKLTLNLRLQ